MTQPTCCEKLKDYLCNYVGKPSIRDDEPLGMDSLGFIRLTAFIESDLRLEIPDEELCAENFTDWNSICEMITRHHPAALSAPCSPSEPDATDKEWHTTISRNKLHAFQGNKFLFSGNFLEVSQTVDAHNAALRRRPASHDREMKELQAELVDLRALRTETLELYLTNEQKALQHRLATAQAALRDVLAMFDEGLIVRDISHDHEPNWIIKAASFTARLARNYQAINAEKEQK